MPESGADTGGIITEPGSDLERVADAVLAVMAAGDAGADTDVLDVDTWKAFAGTVGDDLLYRRQGALLLALTRLSALLIKAVAEGAERQEGEVVALVLKRYRAAGGH
ncbi:MAG TPA: hypothetical protein VFH50_02320 [Acidimicrobiales bacterium]|nr:hypothetical protein [Acidimicrobiales bacterium]